jgi:glyoxylase-like metal-dependent hydrolase (beta-lactamase superfamily II)
MAPVVDAMPLGPIGTNCYLVRARRGASEAVVVDPSGDAATIRLELARMGARCVAILITHGHWDHLLGVADLAEGTGAPVHMAEDERRLLEDPPPGAPVAVRRWTPDVLLRGDETLELAQMSFDVLQVPGHSPAHLAYLFEGGVLSGDVLFAGSVGRTDLPGSSWETLLTSIRVLVARCPSETVVYPGHGPTTILGAELSRNPFLGELRAEPPA